MTTSSDDEAFSSEDLELGATLQLMDPHTSPVETALQLGIQAYRAGRVSEALKYYNFAVHAQPRNAIARLNRASARYHLSDLDGSLADLDQAIEIEPGYVLAYRNRATLHSERGANDLAIADYTRVIELTDNRAERYTCLVDRSLCRHLNGDSNGAIDDCTAAIELEPHAPDAYANRAGYRRLAGELELALEDCTKVIELETQAGDAFFNRGTVYELAGRLDEAAADYAQAVRLDPQLAVASQALARLQKLHNPNDDP